VSHVIIDEVFDVSEASSASNIRISVIFRRITVRADWAQTVTQDVHVPACIISDPQSNSFARRRRQSYMRKYVQCLRSDFSPPPPPPFLFRGTGCPEKLIQHTLSLYLCYLEKLYVHWNAGHSAILVVSVKNLVKEI
jgi:hypothetical protein